MILDSIKNAGKYKKINPLMDAALDLINEFPFSSQDIGTYQIIKRDVYYMITDYTTKPLVDAKFEAHYEYIDIQLLLKGRELIGWGPADTMNEPELIDRQKDVILYPQLEDTNKVILEEGLFAVFFQHDAHMPAVAIEQPEEVRKVVIKVRDIL